MKYFTSDDIIACPMYWCIATNLYLCLFLSLTTVYHIQNNILCFFDMKNNLSHYVASGSGIAQCIKVDKQLVVYIFWNSLMK